MPIVIFVQVNGVTLKLQAKETPDLNHFVVVLFRCCDELHNTNGIANGIVLCLRNTCRR